jgi:2-octaprenylphenol hydroxylase
MKPMMKHYDIVICGAGMVGLCVANYLADAGFDIALIDPKPIKPVDTTVPPLRVSAINLSSERILMELGVKQAALMRAGVYRDMHVWDAKSRGEIHFNHQEIGHSHLGHIVPNDDMVMALWQRLQQYDNVTSYFGERPHLLKRVPGGYRLYLQQQSMMARLIIGADGARSWVREQVGIGDERGSYGQQALVGVLHLTDSHRLTAWQRFLPQGPIGLLPLQDAYTVSMVWTVSYITAAKLRQNPEELVPMINSALGGRLTVKTLLSEVGSFPLHYHHAQRYGDEHVVLVGDAAHAIHPLAGQGVNIGLADAQALAQQLIRAREQGQDWYKTAVIERYECQRRGDNAITLKTMGVLNNLFASQWLALRLLRGVGLRMVNDLVVLKQFFIDQAQ